MNQQNYNRMVEMLIDATKSQRIIWQEDQTHNAYKTQIKGCNVIISTVYDINIDESSFSLSLANPNNEVFNTYTFGDIADKVEYNRLKSLYSAIRDVVYRITESENLILEGLEEVLATSKTVNDPPF